MKKSHKQKRKMKGVALIVVIGVLSLLVIIGTYFAINMQLEQKAAANFLNSVKAKYLAEAGINKVIADIRNAVRNNSYSALLSYISTYPTSAVPLGEGTYEISSIEDEAGKVNINTFEAIDSSEITDLQTLGFSNQQIANIIDYRDYDSDNTTINGFTGDIEGTASCKDKPYASLEEVRIATGIDKDTFNSRQNGITIYKPIIRGGLLGKYYAAYTGSSPNVQIDTTSLQGKVIELGEVNEHYMEGADGDEWDYTSGWTESHDAEFAGGHLVCHPDPANPTNIGLDGFAVIWEGYIEVLPADVGSPIRFWTRSDDGSRLYINGSLVVNNWQDQKQHSESGTYTFNSPGWHHIRLDYYEGIGENTVFLKWKGATYDAAEFIPAERLGFVPLTEQDYNCAGFYKITSLGEVTRDGNVLAEKKISAVIRIFGTWTQTTREEFYAAWFNECRTDSGFAGYADGQVRNVTWLNSCPINHDQETIDDALKLGYWDNFDEDVAYTIVNLKGGAYVYSKNWSYDQNYPTLDYGKYWPVTYNDRLAHNWAMFHELDGAGNDNEFLIYCKGYSEDKDEIDPLEAWEEGGELKHAEINRNYYYADSWSGYDIFAKAWEKDGKVSAYSGNTFLWDSTQTKRLGCTRPSQRPSWEGNAVLFTPPDSTKVKIEGSSGKRYYDDDGLNTRNPHGPPADPYDPLNEPYLRLVYLMETDAALPYYQPDEDHRRYVVYDTITDDPKVYWQPEAPWCTGYLYVKSPVDDPGYNGAAQRCFKYIKDEDGWCWEEGDRDELHLDPTGTYTVDYTCVDEKTLGIIGSGTNYASYVDGNLQQTRTGSSSVEGVVKLANNNLYEIPDDLTPTYVNAIWRDGAGVTSSEVWWDDVRVIWPKGFLVSVPVYVGSDSDYSSSDISWGTISWTEETPANTDIELYLRTENNKSSLPTTDSGWSGSISNGGQITNSGDWLQYKVILSTSAIDTNDYLASQNTPVLRDVTITYLPLVEILSWREETE